jgi:hypothetical protein
MTTKKTSQSTPSATSPVADIAAKLEEQRRNLVACQPVRNIHPKAQIEGLNPDEIGVVSPMTASSNPWLRKVTVKDWHEGEAFGEPPKPKRKEASEKNDKSV